ncbi:MAG: adenosylmethionine--8-amino-7-oxononanoate transaminase [Lentisphaerales bacterium]|nr:adenosylmethionine--8-amino-7-oxononanoate transaminase [Lentisphaerales bacterium]
MLSDLQKRDLKHLWHPCSQMKDYEDFPPIEITGAEGTILQTEDGELIDIISSWWCKSLGHRHPKIQEAVKAQMDSFEHVILANTTNATIVRLCEELIALCPGYDKVFFADSGSDTVEVAMKMSLQYHLQSGSPEKKKFLALENGYHGETVLTLATGDCGLYGEPYRSLMPDVPKITAIPYVNSQQEWEDSQKVEEAWKGIEVQLNKFGSSVAGIVIEPVIQGAGGMLFYHPLLIKKLYDWCEKKGSHLIADEILSGMGRLGQARACELAGVNPHMSVFSKSLTGGFSPLACMLTSNDIFEAFYDDYETGKAFMHSNTYCGSAIGAAAAVASLGVYRDEDVFARVRENESYLLECFEEIHRNTGHLQNIRARGAIVAADLLVPEGLEKSRLGYEIYREAVKRGMLFRPLGNTLYFLPPLNTDKVVFERAVEIASASVKAILG